MLATIASMTNAPNKTKTPACPSQNSRLDSGVTYNIRFHQTTEKGIAMFMSDGESKRRTSGQASGKDTCHQCCPAASRNNEPADWSAADCDALPTDLIDAGEILIPSRLARFRDTQLGMERG
jgi:hypothetical protein